MRSHLSGSKIKIGVNQVAEHLHFQRAFVAIEINKLAASALVDKDMDEEDRRRVMLAVTPKARLLNELTTVQRPSTLIRDLSEGSSKAA